MTEKVQVLNLRNENIELPNVNTQVNEDILKPDDETEDINEYNETSEIDNNDNNDVSHEETIETKLSKKSIIMKINRWKVNFPDELSDITANDNMSVDQLTTLEQECEFIVSTSNCGDMVVSGVSASCSAIEMLSPMVGLNLRGYQHTLMSNPQFNRTLKELSVKYSDSLYTDPWTRLTMSMIQTGIIVHTYNQQNELNIIKEKTENQQVNKDIDDKYKTL